MKKNWFNIGWTKILLYVVNKFAQLYSNKFTEFDLC